MDSNSIENLRMVYPETSSRIISQLMEKYGLNETSEDALGKMKNNETTIGEVIAGIVAEAAETQMSTIDIASSLKEYLDISEDNAERLAEDLKKEILDFVEKVPVEEISEKKIIGKEKFAPQKNETMLPKKTLSRDDGDDLLPAPKKEAKKSSDPDTYREPIE